MIIKKCIIFFFSLLFMIFFPLVNAGECPYGSVHAYFRLPDREWINATAHPQLLRGEPFEIKVNITISCDLIGLFLKLHEFGTPVYEVLTGPSAIEEIFSCGSHEKINQTSMYIWKLRVRPNTTWTNGYGPLEIFTQFKKTDKDSCKVSFDIITAYISDELWKQNPQQNNNALHLTEKPYEQIPGFTIAELLILVIVLILFLTRKRNHG